MEANKATRITIIVRYLGHILRLGVSTSSQKEKSWRTNAKQKQSELRTIQRSTMGNAVSTARCSCRKSSEFIWTLEQRAWICFRIILVQYGQHTDRITISQSIQEHNTKKLFHRWNKSCPVSHNRFYYYPWFMFELHLVLDNLKHKIYNSMAIHVVIVELQYNLTSPQVHSVDQTSKIWITCAALHQYSPEKNLRYTSQVLQGNM